MTTIAPVYTIGFEITEGPNRSQLVHASEQARPFDTVFGGIVHVNDGAKAYMEYDADVVKVEPVRGKPDVFIVTVEIENFKTVEGFYNPTSIKGWLNLVHDH